MTARHAPTMATMLGLHRGQVGRFAQTSWSPTIYGPPPVLPGYRPARDPSRCATTVGAVIAVSDGPQWPYVRTKTLTSCRRAWRVAGKSRRGQHR